MMSFFPPNLDPEVQSSTVDAGARLGNYAGDLLPHYGVATPFDGVGEGVMHVPMDRFVVPGPAFFPGQNAPGDGEDEDVDPPELPRITICDQLGREVAMEDAAVARLERELAECEMDENRCTEERRSELEAWLRFAKRWADEAWNRYVKEGCPLV